MDRRRGLATSAAIAMTVVSGAMAIWPGLGLRNSDRADSVGQFRPAASQAPAPQAVQVGVPSAVPAQPGPPGLAGNPGAAAGGGPAGAAVQPAVPGPTVPGNAAGAGARPGGDDARERACGTTTSTTLGGRAVEYREHDPGYGSCPTQTTRAHEDDRFDD